MAHEPDLDSVRVDPSPLHDALHFITLAFELFTWYATTFGIVAVALVPYRFHPSFGAGCDSSAAKSRWIEIFGIPVLPGELSRKHMPNLKCSHARKWIEEYVRMLCALAH